MMKRYIVSAVALLAVIGSAWADDFPSRTITIVVPYAAGGAMDAVGRVVSDSLHRKFNVASVVDNRVGGSGIIGMRYVAGAMPDGHTLMISSEVGQAIQPAIDPGFPFDSLNTFTPIALVGTFPHFLVARKGLGVNTVTEFVARAKANPGKLNFGSNGVGTIAHVGMEVLKKRAGLDIVNVPYRGAMAAMTDLIGGRVDANIQSLPNMTAQIDNPSLKILAILSPSGTRGSPMCRRWLRAAIPASYLSVGQHCSARRNFHLISSRNSPARWVKRSRSPRLPNGCAMSDSIRLAGTPRNLMRFSDRSRRRGRPSRKILASRCDRRLVERDLAQPLFDAQAGAMEIGQIAGRSLIDRQS